MAFKGLEDRFKAKAHDLYHTRTLKEPGSTQPFVEFAPDDTNRNETATDSRLTPNGSVKRDTTRISGFLKTSDGNKFLVTQKNLQNHNAFSETRGINDSFIIDHVTPASTTPRSKHGTADFAATGDTSQASPASDSLLGGSGRMQVATAKHATQLALGQSSAQNIISLIPSSKLANLLSGVVNVAQDGTTSVNGRPEMTVNGNTLYSILLWKNYQKTVNFKSSFSAVKQNLRVGNIKGAENVLRFGIGNAISSAIQGVNGIINTATTLGGLLPGNNTPDLAGRGLDISGIEGRRYFITDNDNADRYLKNSIDHYIDINNFNVPFDTNNIRHKFDLTHARTKPRLPYANETAAITSEISNIVHGVENSLGLDRIKAGVNAIKDQAQKDLNSAANSIRSAISTEANALGGPFASINKAVQNNIQKFTNLTSLPTGDENPAESAMLFPALSVRQRFLRDDTVASLREALSSQKIKGSNYYSGNTTGSANIYATGGGKISQMNIGFSGGLDTGFSYDEDFSKPEFVAGGYLQDSMNTRVSYQNESTDISPATLKTIHNNGADLIDVLFFDVTNHTVIPFRAYIMGVATQVEPEYNDRKYVGRLERNIVYMGSKRNVRFGLKVHAMSNTELKTVYKKIDALTGLCYPAGYDSGFMVPPLIKFTLGDLYKNQPAYISSLQQEVDEKTPWETAENNQVPHGINLTLSLSLIEKKQMRSTSPFSAISEP